MNNISFRFIIFTMKRLYDYIKPSLVVMTVGITVKALGAFMELLLPDILSRIIDDAVPAKDTGMIQTLCIVMLVCSILALIFNVWANRNASRVSRDITRRLRHDLFDKTLYLTCTRTDDFTIPSLESRLTSDTYNVHQMLGMVQRMGIRSFIIAVVGLGICFWMDAALALVFLACMPFIFILLYIRVAKGIPLYAVVQNSVDKMCAVVRENVQGIRVIKALSRVDYEKNRYRGVNQTLAKDTVKAGRTMAVIQPGMNLFLYLGMAAVILVGAYRVSMGYSKVGVIIAFLSYFSLISRSLMALSRMFIIYSRGLASSKRIFEVLNTESERNWEPGNYPDGDPQYAIEFKDVTFSYLKVKDNVEHISFQLKPGESLGIIGATGAGKTTVLMLLLHFYDIDEGAIYINGKDIRNIEPRKLRSMFGIVMQNDFLFANTVSENIKFGRDISDELVSRAIKDAQADEFIDSLDQELTSKGTNVSGGQKQRILLSRAFAGDPQFLMLDDSSSALDYKTDAKLRKTLKESHEGATKIIVAQRVSSIKNCEHIMVLEKGHIVGLGDDDYLMKNCQIYASVAASQMAGALFE